MHRFYADPDRSSENLVYLTPEDARHAAVVLRLKAGQHIEIIKDNGRWEGEIVSVNSAEVRIRILSSLPSTEPALSITLYQGLPKYDKMELIIQKATELGAVRIVPLLMSRCVVRPDPKDMIRKLDRWRKIAREAGKQSGRCVIPEITDLFTLNQLTHTDLPSDINVVPWEEASGFGPLAFRNRYPALVSLGILIGPEGGIDKQEISALRSVGFLPITLGKRILRTETAGFAAISSFLSLFGEME